MVGLRGAIVLFCLLTGCSAPTARPTDGPAEVPPPDLSDRPFGLAHGFLELAKKDQFKPAYAFLSESARGRVSEITFETELRGFRTGHSQELAQARVLTEVIRGDKARVTLGRQTEDPETVWTLLFALKGGKWVIVSAAGGPFGRHELSDEERAISWDL
ncbi:hypothetical protein DYH09_04485 [bacterium CPR1]|nr:hypothetical protein [bacterium CPR1]